MNVGNVLGSLAICFLVVTHNLKNPKSIMLCDWRQGSSNTYWCINEGKKKPLCFCFPSFVHGSILRDLQAVWCRCLAEHSLWLWLWHDGSVQFLATAKATQKRQRTKAQTWLKCLITKREQKTNHNPSAAERMKQKKDELTCKLQTNKGKTNSSKPFRSRGKRGGNKEHERDSSSGGTKCSFSSGLFQKWTEHVYCTVQMTETGMERCHRDKIMKAF